MENLQIKYYLTIYFIAYSTKYLISHYMHNNTLQ
jgi:hypothetical protein